MQQRGHQIRVLRGDDARSLRLPAKDRLPAGGDDPFHAVWLVIDAAVGVGHIGCGQLHRRDAIGHRPERQREIAVAVLRGDAHSIQIGDGAVDPDLLQQAHGGGVERVSHGGAQRHAAVVAVACVARCVAAGKAGLLIQQHRGGRVAQLKRRAVYSQRLERGAGLPAHLRGAVQPALDGVIPSTDHGADSAAARVQHGHGALYRRAVRCVGREDAGVGVHLVCDSLQPRVKGGIDGESAADHLVRGQPQQRAALAQHLVDIPAVHLRLLLLSEHPDALRLGLVACLPGDESILRHGIEDVLTAAFVVFRADVRGIG